jgi:hypothetical protein
MTPEAPVTGPYGALGEKYANDTFYGNKHSFPGSAEMEFVQASSFKLQAFQ